MQPATASRRAAQPAIVHALAWSPTLRPAPLIRHAERSSTMFALQLFFVIAGLSLFGTAEF